MQVTCSIVKLVLRNNALTSLRGIETLKSVEGLDLSYNVISSILELEILSSLPALQRLWLEGNPICCAPWYRAQVFSLFAYPEKLKLDEKGITTRESWKRQIVLASRLKRPAGFGFYYPAKDNDEEEGNVNTNRKKLSRLALIAEEEQMRSVAFEAIEQDSVSCESEIRSREENAVSEGEAEIVNLMNRVEFMKKEHSVLWLREFKEWMDQPSENFVENNKVSGLSGPCEENCMKNKIDCNQIGQSSGYASGTYRASESSTNLLESDTSFGDSSVGLHAFESFNLVNNIALESSIANGSGDPEPHFKIEDMNLKQVPKVCSHEQYNCLPVAKDSFPSDSLASHENVNTDKEISIMSVTAIDEKIGSHSSSAHPGSPPHYEEDILHRRHNLEEEFMQLSVDSYSLASSDSDTSVSDDGFCQFDTFSPDVGRLQHDESNRFMDDHSEVLFFEASDCDMRHDALHIRQNGTTLSSICDHKDSTIKKDLNENHIDNPDEQAYAAGGILDKNSSEKFYDNGYNTEAHSQLATDEVIKNYFHEYVADSSVSEDYLQSILCDCMLQKDSECKESKVVILLSSANKVYMLLLDTTSNGSGIISEVIGSHMLEEITRVDIGIALQVLRVHIEMDTTYLFITKSVKKTREILSLLRVSDSTAMSNRCSLNSVENVQVELFEKHICGGSNMSIFLYSMLLFWCNTNEEESWVPRSLFVIEGYMIVCVEDLVHFSFDRVDAFPFPYFSLDSCCPISNISEMVIERTESRCVTLTLDSEKFNSANEFEKEKVLTKLDNKLATGSCQWKFKWFSEEILIKFVALLKALHAETATYPLTVRCMS
ncbi:hypothetical protein AQUCO_09100064v1 [Aquilegia coerulea]|uniref:Uncharacterized protein n=1 Tax=Aquilegia coerulea TaxID=218851 RepID=A0A2G5C5T2_AQUCA|nr:hypothetical protein AQUCO_09100064v1 [Aquilegia coerulea]